MSIISANKFNKAHLALSILIFIAALYCLNIGQSFFNYFIEFNRWRSLLGIIFIIFGASLFSEKKSAINIKLVISGILMHLAFAIFALKTTIGQIFIYYISSAIASLYGAANNGISFVFGSLGDASSSLGFIFAFQILPVIVFFGAFMSLLFHIGIIQRIVGFISYLVKPILGTTGPETLCAVANSFLGQTEAPLLIKNYLKDMSRSEFFVVMVSGMGSISGAILAVFSGMGIPAKHLLAASIMSIPASIIISKILIPEINPIESKDIQDKENNFKISNNNSSANFIDAISQGTIDGLNLALNVGAMLIAFLSLLYICNMCLKSLSLFINFYISFFPIVTLDSIFSFICLPFGWLLGFSGKELYLSSELIGTKVAVNELIAYSKLLNNTNVLSTRSTAIITYALCGFSNFSCIGIQIGGIGALVKNKRKLLSSLGIKAVFAATLANILSALVANILI